MTGNSAKENLPAPVEGTVVAGVATIAQLKKARAELRRPLGVRVPDPLTERLRRFCVLVDATQQDVVELALTMFLDAHESAVKE